MNEPLKPLEELLNFGENDDTDKEVDRLLRKIDRTIFRQVNEVIHHPVFREYEKAWRELYYLSQSVPECEQLRLEFLSEPIKRFVDDVLEAEDVSQTSLFQILFRYADSCPITIVVIQRDIGREAKDIDLLSRLAEIGQATQTMIMLNASHNLFGISSYPNFDKIPNLRGLFEGPEYIKWNQWRKRDESRQTVICAVGLALRQPYHKDDNGGLPGFVEEKWRGGGLPILWGSAAMAMARNMVDSFIENGEFLKLCDKNRNVGITSANGLSDAAPERYLEVMLSKERILDLTLNGIAALSWPNECPAPRFLSAQTALQCRTFNSKDLTVQYMAYSKMSWTLMANRICNAIRFIWMRDGLDVESTKIRIQNWLESNTGKDDSLDNSLFSNATIQLTNSPDYPHWWLAHLEVMPAREWGGIETPLHVDLWLPV